MDKISPRQTAEYHVFLGFISLLSQQAAGELHPGEIKSCYFTHPLIFITWSVLGLGLRPSGFDPTRRIHACPGTTGYGYATIFIFYRYGLSPPHLDMPGLGQGFKGYNCLNLFIILIEITNIQHHPLGEKVLQKQ